MSKKTRPLAPLIRPLFSTAPVQPDGRGVLFGQDELEACLESAHHRESMQAGQLLASLASLCSAVIGLPIEPWTKLAPRSARSACELPCSDEYVAWRSVFQVWILPPARSLASSTVTLTPDFASSRAAVSPAMPAPTTMTSVAIVRQAVRRAYHAQPPFQPSRHIHAFVGARVAARRPSAHGRPKPGRVRGAASPFFSHRPLHLPPHPRSSPRLRAKGETTTMLVPNRAIGRGALVRASLQSRGVQQRVSRGGRAMNATGIPLTGKRRRRWLRFPLPSKSSVPFHLHLDHSGRPFAASSSSHPWARFSSTEGRRMPRCRVQIMPTFSLKRCLGAMH